MRGATFTYVACFVLRKDGKAFASIENRIYADDKEEAYATAELRCPKGYEIVVVRTAARSDRQPFLL